MKKKEIKEIFRHTTFFFILFFSTIPAIYAEDGMGDLNLDIEISTTSLQEHLPNLAYNPIDNEFMVLWHTTGVREEGGQNLYSLHGQRVSPEGELLGESFSVLPQTLNVGSEKRLIFGNPSHNVFTNQYMVAFVMGQELTDWDPFVIILDSDGTILSDPILLSDRPTKEMMENIAFNYIRRQYLVAYNNSTDDLNADIFGIILDEDGNVVKEEFAICTAQGEQMNPLVCYNGTDDTYLLSWEDFRNAENIMGKGDIYGALVDGEGNIKVYDIPMIDDYGMDDEGDQRYENIVYNPDRNEFLVNWWDLRPSLIGEGRWAGGIVGRIIKSDGTFVGSDFTLADDLGTQNYCKVLYIKERGMYFAAWEDDRNDDSVRWIPISPTGNSDIYARWLSPSGESIGSDFPISTAERSQTFPEIAYNPLMDRFLIVWMHYLDEEVWVAGGSGTEVYTNGTNVMGKIYGVPSFLTGRVVEQETGKPVEGAWVIVIRLGLALPTIKTTNIGGWFNIAKGTQLNGKYFIIIDKCGYQTAIECVTYKDEPLKLTIEVSKW